MKKTIYGISLATLICGLGIVGCQKDNAIKSHVQATSAKKMTATANASQSYDITDVDIANYPFLATISNVDPLSNDAVFTGGSSLMRIAFRWDNCFRPLGICAGIPIPHPHPHIPTPYSYSLVTPIPSENGEGNANVYIVNQNTIAIFPDQDIYCNDYTVPVTADITFSTDEARALGKSSIVALKGRYQMHSNFTSDLGNHGYVLVNCIIK